MVVDLAKKIFGVDNSFSVHADNKKKKDILILGKVQQMDWIILHCRS